MLHAWKREQQSHKIGRDLEEGDKDKELNDELDPALQEAVVESKASVSVFYCKTCNIHFKDSGAYLDHINGK